MPTLEATNVVKKGNWLTLDLIYRNNDRGYGRNYDEESVSMLKSAEYLINCLVAFQMKILTYERKLMYFVRFVPTRNMSQLTYTLDYLHKIRDPVDGHSEECRLTNERWHVISQLTDIEECTFYISAKLSISAWADPYKRIHGDTDLTDFEIRGEDGSIKFNKAVAAGFSPVIKTGFTGEWGKDGKFVIDAPPGTTKQSLEHLKEYMHTDKIPEIGLRELLLLASYYIIPDLELRCVLAMVMDLSSKEAYDLFEFAMKHQMSKLMFEIMYRVQIGSLNAEEIRSHQKY